jgi:predicted acyltransferase
MVFPFFLYIVGVSIWYSLKKYGPKLNSAALFRILRRSIAIFCIGLFLAIFPYFNRDYSNLRIMGVLQRIALAYGFGALLCLTVRRDYLWVVTAGLLLLYWGILVIFGTDDPFSLDGNFVLRADLAIIGKNHMYHGYGRPFDPEGLLSTIPAIGTVIIGYYTGELTDRKGHNISTVFKLAILGLGLTGFGMVWGKIFPINKPLWTSSYVLYTAGFAMMVFAAIYGIVDVAKFKKWGSFFKVFGINALFSFFLAGIWTRLLSFIRISTESEKITLYNWLYEKIFMPVAGKMTGSLIFAIFQMMIIWIFAYLLYRKEVIIKL